MKNVRNFFCPATTDMVVSSRLKTVKDFYAIFILCKILNQGILQSFLLKRKVDLLKNEYWPNPMRSVVLGYESCFKINL